MSALGHGVELARVDVVRTVRKIRAQTYRVVVFALLFGAMGAGGGYLAYRLGGNLATLDPSFPFVEALRGVIAVFWVVWVFVLVLRSVGQRGALTNAPGVLTAVPTRQAVLGVVLAETVYVVPWVGVPALGVGVGLAVATGTVGPLVTIPAGVVAAGVAAVAVGYPLGLAIKHVLSRFAFVARHKNALIVLAFVAYFVVLTTGRFNDALVGLFEPMQATPVGWYADLAALGVGAVAADPVRAAAAVALTPVLVAASLVAATAVAERHWFSDPVLAGETETPPTEAESVPRTGRLERVLAGWFGRPTAALVALAWRRAARAPMKLLYAAYPLLALAGVFAEIYQSGRIPAYLPFLVVVFVVWAVSVVFTLNPLGDQGAVLPATLLSRVNGRAFVVGHVLAGLVVGLPVGTALTAAVAWVSPVDGTTAAALALATPVLLVVSSVLAVGVGVAFPRYDAVNVTQSIETVVPSRIAFVLYSAHLFATAGAAVLVADETTRTVVAGLVSLVLPFGLTLPDQTLLYLAGAALVPLVLAPLASYQFAVRRYRSFTVD